MISGGRVISLLSDPVKIFWSNQYKSIYKYIQININIYKSIYEYIQINKNIYKSIKIYTNQYEYI